MRASVVAALAPFLLAAASAGCSSNDAATAAAATATPGAGDRGAAGSSGAPGGGSSATTDGGNGNGDSGDGGDAGAIAKGPPPSSLPVTFTRPDVGTPLTQAELDAATDQLVALLVDTRYFDVIDERAHGWPQTQPGYWYGTWWSGVTVTKQAGVVTYQHLAGGADNNGLRTAPYLEGACYAHLLWGQPLTAQLVRKMARGYSSWALAMKRNATDTAKTMLARAQYPTSVASSEGGRSLFIDYSLNRPGIDNPATEYVHLATNPTFGDVWIKNKRSKDDMGQVFRSIVQIQACAPRLDAAGQADLAETKSLYTSWSKQVESEGWSIATLDKNAVVYTPPITETLAHYTMVDNVECPGALMMRLLGYGDPGAVACGSGVSNSEKLLGSQMKSGVKQILRTHHEAAVNMALFTNQTAPALALLQGLVERVDADFAAASSASPPANVSPDDIVSLLLHAANTGVPLTSNEVRWLHGRLDAAHTSYRAAGNAATYRVFDPATPDGVYPFDPAGSGMSFSDIGLVLGSCASPYRNPTARPIVSCQRLLAALPH
ncbi:MAG: hypothetical protein QOI41_5364 [Myxococcales bacterium]|nr:hypothetical protein [Myxococcales bacterium]